MINNQHDGKAFAAEFAELLAKHGFEAGYMVATDHRARLFFSTRTAEMPLPLERFWNGTQAALETIGANQIVSSDQQN
jgi:hypothetical protein